MHVLVLTPEKTLYQGDAYLVRVPGSEGVFEVLENHAPLVSGLNKGEIVIKKQDGEPLRIAIEKGFVEVLNNEVALLVIPQKEEESENSPES